MVVTTCEECLKIGSMSRRVNFFHYVRVPHLKDEDSLQWFTEEIELLVDAVQNHFKVIIDDQKLESAIVLQDRIAKKMREIYMSRWDKEIRVAGSEIMSLSVAEGSLSLLI